VREQKQKQTQTQKQQEAGKSPDRPSGEVPAAAEEEKKKRRDSKQKKLYRPGALFGELVFITQKKWRHATVFALEPSSVVVFINSQLNKLIKVPNPSPLVGAELEDGVPGPAELPHAHLPRLLAREHIATAEDHRLLQTACTRLLIQRALGFLAGTVPDKGGGGAERGVSDKRGELHVPIDAEPAPGQRLAQTAGEENDGRDAEEQTRVLVLDDQLLPVRHPGEESMGGRRDLAAEK
jgi:hypothetical protein